MEGGGGSGDQSEVGSFSSQDHKGHGGTAEGYGMEVVRGWGGGSCSFGSVAARNVSNLVLARVAVCVCVLVARGKSTVKAR
ncbi:hypothetical protein BaRGS_00013051 [Batillaria attramentaria]|uniref:Uncharacterized protein n=1 Tax=Batillaria attramentaria TaxID=370345 RepID=A0ABD0L875_9CAEN